MKEDRPARPPRPALEVLRRALDDAALRDELRRAYRVEVRRGDQPCETDLSDRPADRKEAIFNSW